MVNNAVSVGRNGVHDFILIRASAVILALYTLFMAGFFATTPDITYEIWHNLFANMGFKIFTAVSLFSLLIHAWIGVWQVLSDYIKPALLRGSLQFIFTITLLVYFAAGILTVWGV